MKRSWLARSLLAILSPVFLLLLLEACARLLWHPSFNYSHTGVILSGKNRRVVHEGIEYATNSLGLRAPEIDPGKPRGARRILALGDSFVWGDGIPEPALVTTKLEKALGGAYPGVQVINAGIPGFDTPEELEQLLRLAPLYKPDLVILFFFTNDVLARKKGERGGDAAAASPKQNIKEYLKNHSRFFAFLYYKYKATIAPRIGVPRRLLPDDYFDLDDSKPGWVAFQTAVREMQGYCRANGVKFQLVIIPTLTSLNKNYPYAELRRKVALVAQSLQVPSVDLFDVFAPLDPSTLWVNPENTHWNDKATTLAAAAIAGSIKTNALLE